MEFSAGYHERERERENCIFKGAIFFRQECPVKIGGSGRKKNRQLQLPARNCWVNTVEIKILIKS